MVPSSFRHFRLRYLLNPRYLYTRMLSLRSPQDLARRVSDALTLAGKVASGKYGERYWSRLRRERMARYERSPDDITDASVHAAAGEFYLGEGDHARALEAFSRALSLDPGNAECLLSAGRAYKDRGDFDAAMRTFEKLFSVSGTPPEARREIGDLLFLRGDHDGAIREFENVLRDCPEDGQAHFKLGCINASRGDIDGAIRECSAAIRHGFRSPEAHLELGRLSLARGDLSLAGREFRKASSGGNDSPELRIEKAKLSIAEKKYGRALSLLREDGDRDDDIAARKKDLENRPGARAPLRELQRIHLVKKARGLLFMKNGENARAIRELRRALECGIESHELRFDLARLYQRIGEFDHALAELERGIEYGFDNAGVRREMAKIHFARKEHARALKELETAERYAPRDARIYLEQSRNYRMLNNDGGAVAALVKGLERCPGDGDLTRELRRIHLETKTRGLLLAEKGEIEKAVRELRIALQCGAGSHELHLDLARLHFKAGEYDRALAEFRDGIARGGDTAETRIAVAKIFFIRKEYDRALNELQTAERHAPRDERVYLEQSRNHGMLYDDDSAATALEKGLRRIPRSRALQAELAAVRLRKEHLCINRTENPRQAFLDNRAAAGKEAFAGITCSARPLSLFVNLTWRCNIACIMCKGGNDRHTTLPRAAFDALASALPFIERIAWQGGEPFLVDYFGDLLKEVASKHPCIKHYVTTNGLLITDGWAELLAGTGAQLTFSIDSVVKETYESIRTGARYDDLLGGLRAARAAYEKKYPRARHLFALNVLALKRSADELTLLPDFCREYRIGRIRLIYLDPALVPGEDLFGRDNAAGPGQLARTVRELEHRCREQGIQFECLFRHLLPTQEPDGQGEKKTPLRDNIHPRIKRKPSEHPPAFRCIHPWSSLHIDADGIVRPYVECKISLGDIRRDSLEQLWNGETMKTYRRKILQEGGRGWCAGHCLLGVTERA